MQINLQINGVLKIIHVSTGETLFSALRNAGFHSLKFGDEHGLSGVDTVLLDGKPVNSISILAVQAVGHNIITLESMGDFPDYGWGTSNGLHPLQQAFIDHGAIQCGYCTPAQLLAAKSLLDKNPSPTEDEVREALAGILCRCTGYQKPIEAVLIAAAKMQDREISPLETNTLIPVDNEIIHKVVGKSINKVDSIKLALGKPVFTGDIDTNGILFAKVLHSPHAHARIRSIDTSKASALPGVAAILTWKDIPRIIYSTAGQSDPIPGPLDTFSLDQKVRFVGDRVAFVAAESNEIAEEAIKLINVDYEILPTIINSTDSIKPNAPLIHDELEYVNFANSDPSRNLAAEIRIDIGNVEKGLLEADEIFEEEYEVSKVQQAHLEPHVALSYWDEEGRLIIRSSTQVPFHVRRIISKLIDLPIKRIRVIKPRIGGGFGGKQEVLIEDIVAHLSIATKRPVYLEYSRIEEFVSTRSRHPMKIKLRTGIMKDGTITANEMIVLSDTGAYGCHALTVTGNTGHKSMGLYVGDGKYRNSPNIRFYADVVYTNTPPAGAFRGYGVPQGFWPLERHMEKIAGTMNFDPIKFRLKNAIRPGEFHPFSTSWNEGREPRPEIINTVGLPKCVLEGQRIIDWDQKYGDQNWKIPHLSNPLIPASIRKGIGIACVMQGTSIPYLDMGSASIKLNDDGSFNLLIGATDLGTGSDTVLAQMAAEILGTTVDEIIVYSSDTDFTPFDKGAYASSTTYVSGHAVVTAAKQVAEKIRQRASELLKTTLDDIKLNNGIATSATKGNSTFSQIALSSLHHYNQEQIMAVSSFSAKASPPPFAAQFAEITVDIETCQFTVDQLLFVADSGQIINPKAAFGQVEGGMAQALGYAICEEMRFDQKGNTNDQDFLNYHILRANEMPKMKAVFIETNEPSHPFGVKAVAEIPMDGVAPAVGNALKNALDIEINTLPITPEKIWRALSKSTKK